MYISEQKGNEQFGRKMNQDVNGNRELFREKESKVSGRKVESCSKIKDGNEWLALGKAEVQRIWKKYLEDLYKINTQEEVAFHMHDFDGVWRSNYFVEKLIKRTEVEVTVRKLKNGKDSGKNKLM